MQVVKTGKVVNKQAKPKAMTRTMAEALDGYSINEAIEAGLITSVGDDAGFLTFESLTAPGNFYALINGVTIRTSDAVGNGDGEQDLGDLTFTTGLSGDKYLNGEVSNEPGAAHIFWARLGRPQGMNLATTSAVKFVQDGVTA